VRSRFDGFIRNRQAVVFFVGLANALEDLNRFLNRGFIDHDGLKTPFQGGVAFDVFAVFVQGGCADDLQLAPGKRGFEDVGGVHGRTCRPGADQHMDFVDEQDRFRLFQLVNHPFQTFLELAAVHGASHQRTDVQLQNAFVQQRSRYIAFQNALRKAFHDGGLANTRFPDEGRVVFRAAREDLDDTLDLHLPPNHRIELAFFRQPCEINSQLIHQRGLGSVLLLLFLS
jgi:hypothetical protein